MAVCSFERSRALGDHRAIRQLGVNLPRHGNCLATDGLPLKADVPTIRLARAICATNGRGWHQRWETSASSSCAWQVRHERSKTIMLAALIFSVIAILQLVRALRVAAASAKHRTPDK